MPRLACAIVLALLAATPAPAQDAGAFARLGLGARAAVLGTSSADVFGSASPYHNPALAPFQAGQALEVSAGALPFGRNWQALQVGAPLQPRAGLAAGVVRGGVTDIDGRDGSGYHTGALSADEYAFFVAFGTRLTERVSGGLGLRFYRSDLGLGVRPPTALGVSAGLTARVTNDLALAVVAEDLFARYAWSGGTGGAASVTDRFPLRVRAGAAYRVGNRAVLTADAEGLVRFAEARLPVGVGPIGGTLAPRDTTARYRFGAGQARVGGEVWLAEPFAVRLGVDRIGGGGPSEIRPSVGFAVRQRVGEAGLRIDYAATLEPFASGVMHLATLRVEL